MNAANQISRTPFTFRYFPRVVLPPSPEKARARSAEIHTKIHGCRFRGNARPKSSIVCTAGMRSTSFRCVARRRGGINGSHLHVSAVTFGVGFGI